MKTSTRIFGLFATASTIALFATPSANGQSFLTNGLVAYYPLDGNANDASRNAYNGVPSGTTPTQDRFGRSGMAFAFNGTNSSITCTIPTIPTGTNARTVSLWGAAKLPTSGINLVWWGAGQIGSCFGIIFNGSPANWQAQSWGGGHDAASGVVVDTNWHHLVAAYDGTNLSIAVDGIRRGTLKTALTTGLSPVFIGFGLGTGSVPGAGNYFAGSIDDVRIYNRALSTNEIQQLFQYEAIAPQIADVSRALRIDCTNLVVGGFYQIQVSSDLTTWTNYGQPFMAGSTNWVAYVDAGWGNAFFRLQKH